MIVLINIKFIRYFNKLGSYKILIYAVISIQRFLFFLNPYFSSLEII
jgi:hypothetical protein